ncbi:MAG: secretin and TonB N-terminal domain-containing protein [Candidatus Omnitrophota bacterium]
MPYQLRKLLIIWLALNFFWGRYLKVNAQSESQSQQRGISNRNSSSLPQAVETQAVHGQETVNTPLDENSPIQKLNKAASVSLVQESGTSAVDNKGEKLITLEFKNADIRTVLLMIAQVCDLSMSIGDFIQGKVSVNFRNVSLDEALNAILRTNGCDYVKEGRIYRIVRAVQPTETPEVRVETKVFNLSHIDANAVQQAVTPLLSSNGKIQVFSRAYGIGSEKTGQRSDVLIITDVPEKMDVIALVIEKIDTPIGQVMIEARIIEVSLADDFDLGINWGIAASVTGSKLPTTFPLPQRMGKMGDLVPRSAPTSTDFPGDRDFPFAEKTGNAGFSFGTLSFTDLQAALKALESKRTANLLSCPRVVTLDNQEARIVIGETIPIPTYTLNTELNTWTISGYSSQEVGITLAVTPHILSDGHIIMKVAPEISELGEWVKGPGGQDERPRVTSRKVDTQIKVRNGETVVIGGLLKNKKDQTINKVPFFGHIPLLGLIFTRKDTTEDSKQDLLIFITPRIVTENNARELSQTDKARIEKTMTLVK